MIARRNQPPLSLCCDCATVTLPRLCCDSVVVTVLRLRCDCAAVTMLRLCCDCAVVTLLRLCCDCAAGWDCAVTVPQRYSDCIAAVL
eukprot:2704142-Pyramimonas_sp.AAC.1